MSRLQPVPRTKGQVFTSFDGAPPVTPPYWVPTIRFSDLVKAAGKPEAKSLWIDPRQDRQFMQAVKQRRVMTVVQKPGSSKKDFGEVGFHQQPHASYFVFPRPIPAGTNSKVVGIKYDLIAEPTVKDPVSERELRPVKKSRPPGPTRRHKPVQKIFNVLLRREAVIETSITVTARTESAAKKKAIELARTQLFETSKAVLRTEVKHVH